MLISGNVVIVFIGFFGFLLSLYIRHKKQNKETMTCPLNFKCESVIYSQYSKFFGLSVEIIGLFYYGLLSLTYGLTLIFPGFLNPLVTFLMFSTTTAAFLFSLYLTFIQAVALREWCSWCLFSASLCLIIFILALSVGEFTFITLLSHFSSWVMALHLFGFSLGLGAATLANIFFFKFLKDFKISQFESGILNTFSQIIWFALAFLIVAGVGYYLPNQKELLSSPKFLLQIPVTLIIILSGAFLNLFISPKLVKISFEQKHDHQKGELRTIRRRAFILGAISLSSWYVLLALLIPWQPYFSFGGLFLIYLLIMFLAVTISLMIEKTLKHRAKLV